MKKISIAQIGYGYWGKRLYRYFKANANFVLKYVCALKFSEKGKEFITDIDKIWQDKDIKAVVVATPIKTHYQLIKKALLSGKSVLSEKPLALKSKEIAELKKIAEKKNLVILTEFTYTFSRALQKAKKIIELGLVGDIEAMELSLKYAGRFLEYNVYWLLASHLLSILNIFVPLEKFKFKKVDLIEHNGRVETGLVLFNNKKISGKLTVSLNYPDKEMKVVIYGQKGTLVYSSMSEPSLKVTCYKKTEGIIGEKLVTKEKSYFFDEKNNLKNAVEYFHKVLNKKSKSNTDMALMVTKIIEEL